MSNYQYTPFKKALTPWYDTDAVCYLTIVIMVIVLLCSCAGISVTNKIDDYNGYVWVPVLLMVLSGLVMLSTIIRLIKRYFFRSQNRYLKDFSL